MSPTEDDLRAALSDGAGDTPDADDIVSAAGRQRAQRQKRLLSAAAAVIVVGGVATGGTLLAHHGTSHDGTTGSAAGNVPAGQYAGPEASAASNAGSATNGAAGGGGTGPAACPASVPASRVDGTNAGATGVGERLFAKPVTSAVVCAYPMVRATPGPASVRLTGTDATTLTDSLENAPKTRPHAMCPDYRMDAQETIVVLARASDGSQLPAVTTTINEPACAVVVSNGSTTRYDWQPPIALRQEFAGLAASPQASGTSVGGLPIEPSGTPPVRLSGSPVH